MILRITYFGGRTVEHHAVRYVSAYPMSTPQVMRVEFLDDIEPAMTIELTAVENFVTVERKVVTK